MKNFGKKMRIGMVLCLIVGMVFTAASCKKDTPEVTKASLTGSGIGPFGEATVTLDVDLEAMKALLNIGVAVDVGNGYIMNFVVATSAKPENADPMTYTMCTTVGEGTIAKTGKKGVYTATFTYQYAETDETLTPTGKMLDTTTTITINYADGIYSATLPSVFEGDTSIGYIGSYYNQAMTISSAE